MATLTSKTTKSLLNPAFMRVFVLFGLFTLVSLSGCKKGEDDPVFSLRTRKARVEGKWTIQTGSVYLNYVNFEQGWRDNLMFDLKSSTFFLSRTGYNGKPLTGTGVNLLSLEFAKDGRFTLTETLGPYQLDCLGTWKFNRRSDGKKSKEFIELTISAYNNGTSKSTLFNQDRDVFTYRILELRNKKMVIESSGGTYVDAQTNTHVTFSNKYTLIQN
ncbi:MAG: hypothetical protein IT236_09185 [Bacteroidia bacterium]|nr:hypothetical protein [Bacteroidia bacterium]